MPKENRQYPQYILQGKYLRGSQKHEGQKWYMEKRFESFIPLQGVAMVTGKVTGPDANYFRLHVNQYNTVETITCLSRQVTSRSPCIIPAIKDSLISLVRKQLAKCFVYFYTEITLQTNAKTDSNPSRELLKVRKNVLLSFAHSVFSIVKS